VAARLWHAFEAIADAAAGSSTDLGAPEYKNPPSHRRTGPPDHVLPGDPAAAMVSVRPSCRHVQHTIVPRRRG